MNGDLTALLGSALGVILVNNLVLSQLLGVDTFLRGSGSLRSAARTGLAVTVVMALTCGVCWPINAYILEPVGVKYAGTILFLLVTALLVRGLELLLGKLAPRYRLERGAGLLLTANCAVLGAVLQSIRQGSGFAESMVYSVAGGLGFLLAVLLFAGLRQRLELAECPRAFRGVPIALVTAGLLALCFSGFANLNVFG